MVGRVAGYYVEVGELRDLERDLRLHDVISEAVGPAIDSALLERDLQAQGN